VCIFRAFAELGSRKDPKAYVNIHHKTDTALRTELAQVEAAKADPQKFAVLYEAYYKPVFVFVFRRAGDNEATDDIVSNTFLKALLALPKYQYRGVPFSAFLFRIAMNEVNLYFRKTKRERLVSLDQTDLGTIIIESGQTDSDERRRLLMRALSFLKPDDMQLIELRFFEKRSFAEVGHICGITETNAKVKTYRILDKLKQQLLRSGGW
jgi:RNA polymerase sigma-70 factor (ECF subfamily)